MKELLDRIVEKLEEKARFFNSASDVYQNIRSGVIIAKEIVQEAAAEYEECYKDCRECETYDKEKYHCPKFCKVITEAVKEIEENHNDGIRQFANMIKEVCCKKDEDYDKEIISPKFLNDTIENLLVDFVPQDNNGWIPCSERLPSDCEIHEVTAQFSNGKVYTEFAYYDEAKEEWWKHDNDGLVNAIAWKEPSEPYQPKGE